MIDTFHSSNDIPKAQIDVFRDRLLFKLSDDQVFQ
jgi:hypothetical protein